MVSELKVQVDVFLKLMKTWTFGELFSFPSLDFMLDLEEFVLYVL